MQVSVEKSEQVGFAPLRALREFLRLESASGIVLVMAGALAMIIANSPLAELYVRWLQIPITVSVGGFGISKGLLLWVNDGLMAIFFLLVGLEVKRELLEGELSSPSQVVLPAAGAIGGMIVPASIYAWFNWGDAIAIRGWAIPSATDIAFALGILALLGTRVPLGLKILLMTLAIFDDLAAIAIIALFYTSQLSIASLLLASGAVLVLLVLNRAGVTRTAAYLIVGVVLWVCVLKSGVHATLAGVAIALAIPLRGTTAGDSSPLKTLEHSLHPWVAFGILPLFAFANAGVSLAGLRWQDLLEPVPLGIALGLFVGKQLGVFAFVAAAVLCGISKLPDNTNWRHLYGMSLLCGVGFTMSLFISSLAFDQGGPDAIVTDRLGILAGSLVSGIAGYFWLKLTLPAERTGTGTARAARR